MTAEAVAAATTDGRMDGRTDGRTENAESSCGGGRSGTQALPFELSRRSSEGESNVSAWYSTVLSLYGSCCTKIRTRVCAAFRGESRARDS